MSVGNPYHCEDKTHNNNCIQYQFRHEKGFISRYIFDKYLDTWTWTKYVDVIMIINLKVIL